MQTQPPEVFGKISARKIELRRFHISQAFDREHSFGVNHVGNVLPLVASVVVTFSLRHGQPI